MPVFQRFKALLARIKPFFVHTPTTLESLSEKVKKMSAETDALEVAVNAELARYAAVVAESAPLKAAVDAANAARDAAVSELAAEKAKVVELTAKLNAPV